MGTVATINTAIKADTSHFEKGMGSASAALGRFELSNRDLKQALKEVSLTLGTAGGPAFEFAKSMLEMGPAIGLAVGTVAVFNNVMEQNAERAKNSAENLNFVADITKRLGEMNGTINPFAGEAGKVVNDIAKKLAEAHAEYEKLNKSWLTGKDALNGLNKEINAMQDAQAKALAMSRAAEPRDKINATFDTKMFNSKMADVSPLGHAREEMEILKEKANALWVELRKMPQAGTEFVERLKEARAATEAAKNAAKSFEDQRQKILDDNTSKMQKRDEENDRKRKERIDKLSSAIGTQFTAFLGAEDKQDEADAKAVKEKMKRQDELQAQADKMMESVQSPLEKFEAEMREAKKLKDAGVNIDLEKLGKGKLKDLSSQLDSKDGGGFARQFDTTLIDVKGLAMSGKDESAKDETLKEGVGYLKTMGVDIKNLNLGVK